LKHNLLRLVALGCKENSFSGCKSQITTLSTFKKQSGSLQFPANERPTPKVFKLKTAESITRLEGKHLKHERP